MHFKRMDMHVHSCHSSEAIPGVSGVLFSPKETPEELYDRAKARGMDFVTITDHDTIDGCLDFVARRPGVCDFVVGEEVSSELPVSGLTVHINVYGHSLSQHDELQRRRGDAFEIARFCKDQGLFFCWNHPFYRENLSTIEEREFMRLVAEVPVLEVRNGGRMQLLNVLAEEVAVCEGKGLQGGSDTHTGNIGSVYTAVPCSCADGFFSGILAGESRVVGRHSTRHDFMFHNYLVGARQTVASACEQLGSPLARSRVRWLGVLAVLLSPWIVRRHFRGQLEMARIALSNLSAFGELPRTLLDAA